jgi:hypothetical protein
MYAFSHLNGEISLFEKYQTLAFDFPAVLADWRLSYIVSSKIFSGILFCFSNK